MLLQPFSGIRPERRRLEQLDDNQLVRRFVRLSPEHPIWHSSMFIRNRERVLKEQGMGRFLEKLMGAPEVKPLLSNEHFSADSTLLQAGTSHASLERLDGQDEPPLSTDPDAVLCRESKVHPALRSFGATCSWTTATT